MEIATQKSNSLIEFSTDIEIDLQKSGVYEVKWKNKISDSEVILELDIDRHQGNMCQTKKIILSGFFSDLDTDKLNLPEYKLWVATPEMLVARKYCVMVSYADGFHKCGSPNTRMKDYYDIWKFIMDRTFTLQSLKIAIEEQFAVKNLDYVHSNKLFDTAHNEAHEILWKNFVHRTFNDPDELAIIPPTFNPVVETINEFMLPIVQENLKFDMKWDNNKFQWERISQNKKEGNESIQ